jgi:hypothetical protein
MKNIKHTVRVTVYITADFDVIGDKSHRSISGGVATHSFDKIDEFTTDNYKQALEAIVSNYGTPYIFDDRLELQLNESESLSFYIEEQTTKVLDNDSLKEIFPDLKEQ